jgi:tetratricopeptide (TPR) repeat protein
VDEPDAALPAKLKLDAMAFVPPPDAAPPIAPVPKRELDALLEKAGEPLAPESCRATDAATVKRLEEAARALYPKGDSFGALAALADARGDLAEEWALRARAQLANDAARALVSAEEAARLCPTYAVAHNLAGNALQKMGKLDQAEEAYERALHLNESVGDKVGSSSNYNNLAVIFANRSDPNQAFRYYRKSLKLDREIGNLRGVAIDYNNMGTLCFKMGRWERSLAYYARCRAMAVQLGDLATPWPLPYLKGRDQARRLREREQEAPRV